MVKLCIDVLGNDVVSVKSRLFVADALHAFAHFPHDIPFLLYQLRRLGIDRELLPADALGEMVERRLEERMVGAGVDRGEQAGAAANQGDALKSCRVSGLDQLFIVRQGDETRDGNEVSGGLGVLHDNGFRDVLELLPPFGVEVVVLEAVLLEVDIHILAGCNVGQQEVERLYTGQDALCIGHLLRVGAVEAQLLDAGHLIDDLVCDLDIGFLIGHV